MTDVRRPRPAKGEVRAYFLANLYTEVPGCKMWPFATTNNGYGVIVVNQERFGVHVLACQAFNGPKPFAGAEALHGECNQPGCWSGFHLRWGSHYENMMDRVADGTLGRGTTLPQAKLTETKVRLIRSRWATGESLAAIAADFGVTKSTVSNIGLRQRWAWLE